MTRIVVAHGQGEASPSTCTRGLDRGTTLWAYISPLNFMLSHSLGYIRIKTYKILLIKSKGLRITYMYLLKEELRLQCID